MSKIVAALLVAVLTVFSADSCGKYDVPAGGDRGDSVGDNQPCLAPGVAAMASCPEEKCQPGQIQLNPVGYQAPEVYQYSIFVEIEDEDCGSLELKNKMRVERDGAYLNKDTKQTVHMVWDDGKSGAVNVQSPYHTKGIIEKSIPHNIGVIATVSVTTEMIKAGAAWLTCRIERDAKLVTGPASVGLARVAITGIGVHTVHCRTLT